MNKKTTWRKVLSVLFVAVMLLSMTFVGVLSASAEETTVAKIGDTEYTSLQAAINAATAGETTIVLLADVSENVTVSQAASKNIVVNGNGKTFAGKLTINGNSRTNGAESLTFNNVVFTGSIVGTDGKIPHNVKFNGCDFVTTSGYLVQPKSANYNWSFVDCTVSGTGAFFQANKATNNLYVENLVATNSGNVFKIDYCSTNGKPTATFKNVDIKNAIVAFYISNRNNGPVYFENVSALAEYPILMYKRNTTVFTKLNFSGDNVLTSTVFGTDWLTGREVTTITGEETVRSLSRVANLVDAEGNVVNAFFSIQDAINAANDGDTVVVTESHTVNRIDRDHFVAVEGNKTVTLDLNGKTLTADANGISTATAPIRIFHATEGSTFIITDTSAEQTGTVIADGTIDSYLAYMFGNDGTFLIEGGNYQFSGIKGGAMFWSTNNGMTVNGGTFYQLTTGWMFNAKENRVFKITVNGGTFNRDFLNPVKNDDGSYTENVWGEVVLGEGEDLILEYVDNGDGTWSVINTAEMFAQINGGKKYTSLQKAIDAAKDGDVITLLKDINLDGSTAFNGGEFGYNTLFLVDGKNITIDFGGNYINVDPESAGESNVALKNHIISVIFVNNNAGLTLTGEGGITTSEDSAFTMYSLVYNHSTTLIVDGGEYIGKVSDSLVYADGVHSTTLNGGNYVVTNYTINKSWATNVHGKNERNFIVYAGGTFNHDPLVNQGSQKDCEVTIAEGYHVVDNGNGTWSVVTNAARIGDVQYATLAEALAAVQNGETIVLLSNNSEKVTIKQVAGKNFTIDGDGKTFSGIFTIDGGKRHNGKDTLTFTNINFKGNSVIATAEGTYAHNVTVDGCTFTGTSNDIAIRIYHAYDIAIKNSTANGIGELLLAQKAVTGLTVENVTVENCYTAFYLSYGVDVSFTNLTVTGTTSGYSVLYKNNSGKQTLTFNGCKLDAPISIYATVKTSVVTIALNDTEFTGENWLTIAKTGASVKAEFSGEKLALAGANYDADYYTVHEGANCYVFSAAKIKFASSNLLLGETFGIYFNVDPATYVAGPNYVAVITNANGDVVAEIPADKWDGTKILYTGLSAKQMADEFTVVITCNGNVVSGTVTESIKGYVARGIEKNSFDAKTLELLTAMLNYGAEAQKSFDYNTEDLANTVVADREVTNVEITDNTVAGAYWYGASLNLESSIYFNFKFLKENLPEVAKAYVTYVDANGENVCLVIDKTYFETTTQFEKELYVVKVNTANAADVAAVFTCTLLDANNNVITSAQDSIISYCARAIDGMAEGNGYPSIFPVEFYQAAANYAVALGNYKN